MTQPALSRQIAELEDELGQTLFDRSTRRIELTEKGLMLFQRAVKILELVERTREEVMQRQELSGVLSLVAAEMPVMQLLSPVLGAFTQQHPAVRVQLQSSNAVDAALALKTGTADVGVFNLPADLSSLDYFLLPEKNVWGVLTQSEGPLARKSTVDAKELLDTPLFVPRQQALANLLAGRLGRGREIRRVGTYNLLYNASLLVHTGAAVLCIRGIVPEENGVVFRPLEPALETEVAVAWPHEARASRTAQAFLEALGAAFGKAGDKR